MHKPASKMVGKSKIWSLGEKVRLGAKKQEHLMIIERILTLNPIAKVSVQSSLKMSRAKSLLSASFRFGSFVVDEKTRAT